VGKFRVFVTKYLYTVMWDDDGVLCKVTANRGSFGAVYAREVSPGSWRSAAVRNTHRIKFTDVTILTSLVRRMLRDDTLPRL
jgi:hypothetical protein